MGSGYYKGLTLKTRMALAITPLFVLFVITTLYLTHSYFERTFKETISVQQFSLAASLSDSIDDKLRIAQNALKAVAAIAPADVFTNPDKAQRFLDEKAGLLSIFDNGIFFINKDGRLIVESPYRPDRRGKDLSSREWVQKTVSGRKPYISEPYLSTHTPGLPAIVMTAPIFDQKGKMTGMMTGSLDLLGGNFLAVLSRIKIGTTGYIFIAGMNRMIVVHPDKNRIMKPTAPAGTNRMVDRAFEGFEGSGETVTSRGVPMLISIKHMSMAPWFLATSYPQSEAYAPLHKAERYFVMAAVAGTVLFLLVTWLTMKRLMAPLAVMTRHVAHLPEKQRYEHHIAVDSADEIGVLAAAFNTMIDTLDRQQDELRDQKQRVDNERGLLDTLINAIPDMIFFKDQNGVYRRCNDACAALAMGMPMDRVIGRSDNDLFPPDFADLFRQRDREAMDSGQSSRHEEMICPATGGRMIVETIKVPIRDAQGHCRGIIGIARDITERKLSEERLHKQRLQLEKEVAERQVAQEALSAKQQQLEELNNLLRGINDELEERISQAVSELRQKDRILIQQHRQAAMGEMINNIAHQWRQPLNNIALIIQNMMQSREYGELTFDQMRADVGKTMETIRFMSQTIDDFRNYFLPDKEKVLFSVKRAVNRTISIIEGSNGKTKISVESDVGDDPVIYGYSNEYSQVLLNILINAREALAERNIHNPEIRIAIRSENEKTVVTIGDNAGGIPESIIDKIFDPYFSTKSPDKGTGVGLFMSKSIIEGNMNGSLTVCNVGEGAEFRIEV